MSGPRTIQIESYNIHYTVYIDLLFFDLKILFGRKRKVQEEESHYGTTSVRMLAPRELGLVTSKWQQLCCCECQYAAGKDLQSWNTSTILID